MVTTSLLSSYIGKIYKKSFQLRVNEQVLKDHNQGTGSEGAEGEFALLKKGGYRWTDTEALK